MEQRVRQKTTKMKKEMEDNGYDDSTFFDESEESNNQSSSNYSSSEDEQLPTGFFARIKYRFMNFVTYIRENSIYDMKDDLLDWYEDQLFLFRHSSQFKENWDFLIMLTACWNVFMLPINIAFSFTNKVTDFINNFVDFCFVIDIIVVFRTTIYDEESGEEIDNWRVIADRYLKGRFAIDFLSTVPFDSIAVLFMEQQFADQFKLLGVLKLIRVLRLNKIIMYLNVKQDIKASIKLVKLIFFLLMYVHFVACIWFYIINIK